MPARPAREDERIVIEDARAIRALAHPARLAIIEALAEGDELTATDCAELTGLTPSATAYHLKALEKWGFVQPAPARADGRERPWRAAGRGLVVRSTTPGPAELAVAEMALARNQELLRDFIANQEQEPVEWREAVELGNSDLWLTLDEVHELSRAFSDLVDSYRGRRAADRPDGSRRVRVTRLVVPRLAR